MRTLLIPAAFLTAFSALLLSLSWTATQAIQRADAPIGINVMQTIAGPWHDWQAPALPSRESEHVDEVGFGYIDE